MAKREGEEAAALARARAALLEVPPHLFVAERKKRARALKDEGFAGAAKALASERKPSPSVWALNRLARRDDAALKALLQSAERVRTTQRRAVSGGGADELREAQRAFQAAVAAALKAAVRTLREAKAPSSPQVQERMRDSLMAAATGDDEVREALREGTLVEDVSAAGFGFVSPLQVLKGGAARQQGTSRKEEEEAEREAARREAAAHERERKQAEEAVAQAEKRATMLERFATVAEARAREARQRADEASRALKEAKAQLASLRRGPKRQGR